MANSVEMDQLAINTIRMLVVDAVQKAKSGHPGTPMDAAPAAYTLWQRVLRYDPAEPGWINRDRFVLSSGHASMLLYSLIHLAGIKAANRSYEQAWPRCRHAGRHQDLSPGRQPLPWTSGIRLDLGRRDDHRSAGAGRGNQRRHGDRRTMAAAPPTIARASICSTSMSMRCAATAT